MGNKKQAHVIQMVDKNQEHAIPLGAVMRVPDRNEEKTEKPPPEKNKKNDG